MGLDLVESVAFFKQRSSGQRKPNADARFLRSRLRQTTGSHLFLCCRGAGIEVNAVGGSIQVLCVALVDRPASCPCSSKMKSIR
jgi:hypothetical protein